MKSNKHTLSGLVLVLLFSLVQPSDATTISPFLHIGDMANATPVVVEAKALTIQSVWQSGQSRLVTSFEVVTNLKENGVGIGTSIRVLSDSYENRTQYVTYSSDVSFKEGKTYLLFLSKGAWEETWRPAYSSYGVFEVRKDSYSKGTEEVYYPLFWESDIHILPRPDGQNVTPFSVYKKNLIPQLETYLAGSTTWQEEKVAHPKTQSFQPKKEKAAPAHCNLFGIRWRDMLTSSIPVYVDSDATSTQQGFVSSAVSDLSANYSGINLGYSGTVNYAHTNGCTSVPADAAFTSLFGGTNRFILVVFEDPCNQMINLTSCEGVLATGGLAGFISAANPVQQFDGTSYLNGSRGFAIINNGVSACYNATNMRYLISHEMTHALGLDHIEASSGNANMNPSGQQSIKPLDVACVDYLYPDVATPVEWGSFVTQPLEASILLRWETLTETENKGFEIQRAVDKNKVFETIGFVEGSGGKNSPSKYTFEDKQPVSGLQYYRLRQIDYDNSSSFSKTISARFAPTTMKADWANDGIIRLWSPREQETRVVISDLQGKIVYTQKVQLAPMDAVTLIPPMDTWARGVYVLQVSGVSDRVVQKKFIR